jgi:hypothetical protein
MRKKMNNKTDKQQIRFIDTRYKTLFFIEDGGEVEIENKGTGQMEKHVCHYIDEYHARIGEQVFHIFEFARAMELYSRIYRSPEKIA